MSEYLTCDELVELTDAQTRPAQRRWLDANGFRYVVSAKGQIKVLRAHRDAKLGQGATPVANSAEPDFSVFRRAA
jgi:hypothetical protein